MSVLLEQALRIKEEVAASLHSTQGCVQSEASSRRLLESHIHVILPGSWACCKIGRAYV